MPEVAKITIEVAGGVATLLAEPRTFKTGSRLLRPGESPGHGRPSLPGQRQHRGDRQQAR